MKLPDPFAYPATPHTRKHAPSGYKDYADYKPWLRDEFEFRCVYCLQREMWSRERHAIFSVDHVVPQTEDLALICVYTNLVYACLRCNSARQDIRTIDPTVDPIGSHLRVEQDGTVVGLDADGLFLIQLLHLNSGSAVAERRRILRILRLRAKYPRDTDIRATFLEALGYPEDLPDLRLLKPPGGNTLATNALLCFLAQREQKTLPPVY
jgi:hypothetical protein